MRLRSIIFGCFAVLSVSVIAHSQMDRLERENMRSMLKTAAAEVAKNFYDPNLKGLDWKALVAEADTKIQAAKTPSEAITIITNLIDRLDDSHTKFIPPGRVNRPLFGFDAKMFGDTAYIYDVKPGGSADKAGLKMGDRILQIFNYRPERRNFDQAMLYYRVIRPMPELKITYQRGNEEPKTIVVPAKAKKGTMVQDMTKTENIYNYLYENWYDDKFFYGSAEGDIGYVQLPAFSLLDLPVPDVENAKAFVIDLRGNHGGLVDGLVNFAGHFVAAPAVMNNEIGRKKTEQVKIKPKSPKYDVPLVVLLDSHSASASEMFARYFQKIGRAKIVGDASSGRVNTSLYYDEQIGTDRFIPFGVQIAIAKVAFEDGEELEHHPVVPDYPCLPGGDDLRAQSDPCLFKAFSVARKLAGRGETLPDMAVGAIQKFVKARNDYIDDIHKRAD